MNIVAAVGHNNHDSCFHVILMETGVHDFCDPQCKLALNEGFLGAGKIIEK